MRSLAPEGLACAVLRQAVRDARAGHDEAAAWLQSCWGELWARAAGLDEDHAWTDVLSAQGFRPAKREYMPERDHADVTAKSEDEYRGARRGRPRTSPVPTHFWVKLVFMNDALTRAVVSDLRYALVSCDGDLPAALGELRGTPAGDRLLTWLTGGA